MTRVLAVLVVLAGAVGLALAPRPDAADAPPPARAVVSAVLACPELAVTEDSASTLASLVAPVTEGGEAPSIDAPGTPSAAGASQGAAVLRRIDAGLDLARIPGVADPVSLLVAGRSQPPIVVAAAGGWAASTVAGVATAAGSGAGAGIAAAGCPAPASQWWFVGAGSQVGRGSALLVSNPAPEPARFDLALYAGSGPVDALAGRGIDLGPRSHVRLRLDALVEEQELLAVQVRTTGGQVVVALRDVAAPRDEVAQGVDYIPAAVAPTTSLAIGAAPPGEGSRVLVLVNPGTQFATVTPRLVTEQGTGPLPGAETLTVPAGSVMAVPVQPALLGRAGTLLLRSDQPITGGLRSELGTDQRELTWLSAVPAVAAPNPLAAAAAVPVAPGLETTVTVTAPGAAVTGTLQAWVTGASADSILERGDREAPSADGGQRGGGPQVITGDERALAPLRIAVPAGALRSVAVPGLSDAALAHLVWRSDAGSGPAIVSSVTSDPAVPLLTGSAWWPTRSAVPAVPVREDVGTLAPTG